MEVGSDAVETTEILSTETTEAENPDIPSSDDTVTNTEAVVDTTIEDDGKEVPANKIDEILEAILGGKSEEKKEEVVEEKKEEKKVQIRPKFEGDEVNVLELQDKLKTFEENIGEKDATIKELNTKLDGFSSENKELKDKVTYLEGDNKKLEKGLTLLSDHPILGPLALKVVQGEEVNIPKYLADMVKKEVETLPKMGEVKQKSVPQKTVRPKDRLIKAVQRQY